MTKSKKVNKEKIKEIEHKKPAVKAIKAVVSDVEKEISFDEWYMIRSSFIPKIHMKEILQADFKSRGLGNEASLARWDAALEKYGIKLKK